MEEDLIVSYEDGLQLLILNRPKKKNPIRVETCAKIIEALSTASKREDVKITLITGKGEYFSSGFELLGDPGEIKGFDTDEFTNVFKQLIDSAIDYPKPLIALVNGPAIGLGVTFLGLCDIVYALETATFKTPFASLSLIPEGCSSYIFPRVMGPSMASQMLFFSYTMSASEAKACNFVAKVLKASEVPNQIKIIKEWAKKTPLEILLIIKKLTRSQNKNILHQVNRDEVEELKARFQSDDIFETPAKLMRNKTKKSKL